MKKILIITGALFLVLANYTYAQSPFLTYKFGNPLILSGTPDTLIFDVLVKCDVTGTYHTDLSVYLNYNSAAFGSNVSANGKISLVRAGLTAEEVIPGSGIYKYNFLPIADNTSSRVAFGTESALGYGNLSYLGLMPDVYVPYVKVKLVMTNPAQNAGLTFQENLMNGNQFYETVINNPLPYGTCVYANNLNELPLEPNTNVIFSEIADPSNSSANFIEIYNAGTSLLDFDNYYTWYLNFNGSSSVQLEGTLAVGETYVVANNATDFGTAYPGKSYDLISSNVGTVGTTNYLLTTYGDYLWGTSIDVYNGGDAGFDFTGKHAVRHYPVIAPNMTPTASEWVISAAENMDMTPGSHRATLTWDGSSSSSWRNQSNWAQEFIPDAGHNVSIPNAGETTPTVGFGENAYCQDVAIGGATSGLTILSDQVDGDGSFINYGSQTGIASVQRFLEADRYWYISQPVTSAVAGVFLHTWMFTYDETVGDWDAFIEPESTPLNVMRGYAVWTSSINPWHQGWDPVGDTTVAYVGTLNTGAVSTPLTYTNVGSSFDDGWNFTGNPYPSAVDWEAAGWTKTNLQTNAYSVWNGTTYGTYTAGSGGNNGATRYIPAAQGFFVRTSTAGTLGVTNQTRVHNPQAFWKSDENMMNRLSLVISNGEMNDETVIYFNENASTGLDYDYDAAKLMATAAPQCYTMFGEVKMAINTFNNTTETASVKMGVNAPESGEYTITASNLESFDANTPIYLEDLVTGQITNLRQNNSYSFSSEEGTSERFLVHFSEVQGIGDPNGKDVTGIYAYNHEIYVDFNGTQGEIQVYNILGQEVNHSVATNGMNILSVNKGNAVYVVKVISETATVTKKVFVK